MSDWRTQAACLDQPTEWWFVTDLRDPRYHRALAICAGCPVEDDCLDDALTEEFGLTMRGVLGIRGGMNQTQRRQMLVRMRPVAS